ncbi:translation initiation factor IF-5A [Ignicoccus islandicus DSM 13165]|uniref:Translation initiation factor 5A n=1 Tax=Ignicoccus islandicus DSM 13165 TaxID=940295 RepID=A0A0U2WL30_9CREN|nr:translation initiation factor IF-5A [Ignicoccus islandicus]ALU11649.1 translation initiation factor IF-5A [Ignicoccus islandicus DSM 13165]
MSKTYATLGELKVGNFIMIDGEPCKIVSISKAKTGKHGSAKANVVAISLLSGSKKTLVAPVDTRVEVPIIEKRVGQVLAVTGDSVQLMDMESYDTFEVPLPEEEEIKSKLEPGVEVEYWILPPNVYKIMRIRGGGK